MLINKTCFCLQQYSSCKRNQIEQCRWFMPQNHNLSTFLAAKRRCCGKVSRPVSWSGHAVWDGLLVLGCGNSRHVSHNHHSFTISRIILLCSYFKFSISLRTIVLTSKKTMSTNARISHPRKTPYSIPPSALLKSNTVNSFCSNHIFSRPFRKHIHL